jgi:hypothetical protein
MVIAVSSMTMTMTMTMTMRSSASIRLLFLRGCGGGKVEIEQVCTRWNLFLFSLTNHW